MTSAAFARSRAIAAACASKVSRATLDPARTTIATRTAALTTRPSTALRSPGLAGPTPPTRTAASSVGRLRNVNGMRSDFSHKIDDRARLRIDRLRANANLGLAKQLRRLPLLFWEHHGHHVACGASARRAARTVQVRLVLGGRVHVHHQFHSVNVNAAGRHIRGHQHAVRGS